MTNPDERARQARRRQLIERLNKKEELLGRERMAQERIQMTEEELEAAIERERNDWRNQFGYGGVGV
jgi:hypothetical protein